MGTGAAACDAGEAQRHVGLRGEEGDELAADVAAPQRVDGLVEKEAAAVDHDDAVTHALHVARVVRGEEDGAALLLGTLADDVADRGLGRHVEADRRLVEEHDLGGVQEAGHDLAAHPLAQGELADGLVELVADPEHLHECVAAAAELGRLLVVNPGEELERVGGGEVVPELGALAEHGADPVGEPAPLLPRDAAGHAGLTRGGVEDPRQDLDRGRLAGAVGADEGDALAGGDGERHAVDGDDLSPGRGEQARNRAAQSRLALGDGERAGEVLDQDRVFHGNNEKSPPGAGPGGLWRG